MFLVLAFTTCINSVLFASCFPLCNCYPDLVCTKIDFGNAAYIGFSCFNILKLQSILNASACLIGGILRFVHVSASIRNSLTGCLSISTSSLRFFALCTTVFLALICHIWWLFALWSPLCLAWSLFRQQPMVVPHMCTAKAESRILPSPGDFLFVTDNTSPGWEGHWLFWVALCTLFLTVTIYSLKLYLGTFCTELFWTYFMHDDLLSAYLVYWLT